MLVSAIIGALDTLHAAAPAEVLCSLNDLLLVRQQGGFATCLCAVVEIENLQEHGTAVSRQASGTRSQRS
jgi:hypothetical protein